MATSDVLTRRPDASAAVSAVLAFAGAVLVARASYVVGGLPGRHVSHAVATGPYRWMYVVGVALMVLAWLALGRIVLDDRVPGSLRRVLAVGVATGLPLLVAAPVTSQDVWAYLGQGNVAAHGLDPYATGPGAVPGALANAVAPEWVDATSPYGTLWIALCRLVTHVVGEHPWAGMFVLRGLAVLALVALGAALTRLTRTAGGRPEVALWLAVTGPFPLLMLVAAVHNDSLMLALLVAGLLVAASQPAFWRALVLGAVLIGLAASVKITALVALPFLPLVWWKYADPGRRVTPAPDEPTPAVRSWVSTSAAATVVGAVTVLALGVLTGLGTGWIHSAGDGLVGGGWMSVPTQVGNLLHQISPQHVAARQRDRGHLLRPIALAFTLGGLVLLWFTARRRPPLRTLALVLLVVVIGGTAPRIWYLLWPLALAAVLVSTSRPPRALLVIAAAGSATLVLWFDPATRPHLPVWALAALFAPLCLGILRWVLPPARTPTTREPVGSP